MSIQVSEDNPINGNNKCKATEAAHRLPTAFVFTSMSLDKRREQQVESLLERLGGENTL